MNSELFRKRLKQVMGDDSNRSFSLKCDISEMTMRRYLLGDTFPPIDTLDKIAQVSGYELGWLASGKGHAKPVEQRDYGDETGGKECACKPDQDTADPELAELMRLLKRYGNEALKDDLKLRLLRIKTALEG